MPRELLRLGLRGAFTYNACYWYQHSVLAIPRTSRLLHSPALIFPSSSLTLRRSPDKTSLLAPFFPTLTLILTLTHAWRLTVIILLHVLLLLHETPNNHPSISTLPSPLLSTPHWPSPILPTSTTVPCLPLPSLPFSLLPCSRFKQQGKKNSPCGAPGTFH